MVPMILLAGVVISASPSDTVLEWERVTHDRRFERVEMCQPIFSTRMFAGMGTRVGIGRNVGSPGRHATVMDNEIIVGIRGASAMLSVPFVVGTNDPTARVNVGNIGVFGRGPLIENDELAMALVMGLSLPTARNSGRRALLFATDLPKYAPSTTTVTLGIAAQSKVWRGILGGSVGVDTLLYGDPAGDDVINASFWSDLYAAVPILTIDETPTQTVMLTPVAEARGRGTVSSQGTATEIALAAGIGLHLLQKSYIADAEEILRTSISAGYQATVFRGGPGEIDPGGRLMLVWDVSYVTANAAYAPAQDRP